MKSPIKVDPNGSANSIIAFGFSRKLDLDQQTAFEILTATFVLTFIDDTMENAMAENVDASELRELKAEKERLELLAQKNHRDSAPLVLFITGPAGAGKCELHPLPKLLLLFFF